LARLERDGFISVLGREWSECRAIGHIAGLGKRKAGGDELYEFAKAAKSAYERERAKPNGDTIPAEPLDLNGEHGLDDLFAEDPS
jgi:hypothetical protein